MSDTYRAGEMSDTHRGLTLGRKAGGGGLDYAGTVLQSLTEAHLGDQSEELPIHALLPAESPRIDGVNEDHARALAEGIGELPPILVHVPSMRIVDGMHRVRAAQIRGEETIQVRYFEGDPSAAFVASVVTNVMHGLPLSLADREAAAARIVQKFPHWSNRAIARVSGLSDKTIGAIRVRPTGDNPQSTMRVGRDGRVRPLDSSDARRRASEVLTDNPDVSLRSVARMVGLSPATVRDVRDRLRKGEDPVASRRGASEVGRQSRKSPGRRSRPQEWNRPGALENLKKDPSLRLNDAGKELLRWLELHTRLPDAREGLVNRIPPHCVEPVLYIALECSAWWETLAQQLELKRPDV